MCTDKYRCAHLLKYHHSTEHFFARPLEEQTFLFKSQFCGWNDKDNLVLPSTLPDLILCSKLCPSKTYSKPKHWTPNQSELSHYCYLECSSLVQTINQNLQRDTAYLMEMGSGHGKWWLQLASLGSASRSVLLAVTGQRWSRNRCSDCRIDCNVLRYGKGILQDPKCPTGSFLSFAAHFQVKWYISNVWSTSYRATQLSLCCAVKCVQMNPGMIIRCMYQSALDRWCPAKQ